MKKYLFLIYCLLSCYDTNADQTFVSGYDYSSVSSFSDSVVYVENGAVLSDFGNTITMSSPVYLYNNGRIKASLYTDGYNLFVYNSGTIDGNIDATGGNVVQVIRSDAEYKPITVTGGNMSVIVDNYYGVNLNNIKNIDANHFTINESRIEVDNFSDWQNWDKDVVLEGNISLIIKNPDTVNPGEVIRHTSEDTSLNVQIIGLDRMYKPQLTLVNGGLVLNIVRETNYDVVFGYGDDNSEERTSALELIRKKNPQDKFIQALDAASSMEEINQLKNLSYRFNHEILLRPVKVINNFSLLDTVDSVMGVGVGIIPYYIISNNLNNIGGRVYVGYQSDDLYFSAGFSFNKFTYEDSLNEFSGAMYSLDIKSKQIFNKFWLQEKLGASLTDFRADYISTYGDIKENPLSLSWYGDVETGYDFNILHDIIFSPIVGFSYQQYNVADVSETDSYIHGGMNTKYSFITDGIKYEYSLSGAIGTNNNLFADIRLGFVSITDNAGASLGTSVFKDEFGYNYKFFIDAKFSF